MIGLAVGSFLNCVIYRLDKEESFLKGRSFCPSCRHELACLDLIPVLSFLVLKRKCRYCGKKISWQYPLVELGTGFLFVLLLHYFWPSFSLHGFLTFIALIFISSSLIVIFIYDLRHYIIPDKVIYPAIAVAFIYQLLKASEAGFVNFDSGSLLYAFFGAGLVLFFFLFIFLISQGNWLGFGEVKLVFFLGLFLGWPNILIALFSSFLIGALIGTGLIALKRKTLKSEVPFAPFLVMGTFIALFWGEAIFNWYISYIIY